MSAAGMNLRLFGVSSVLGRIAMAVASGERPDPGAARDRTSWWTAAFAIPYPIIVGVPARAGAAPHVQNRPSLSIHPSEKLTGWLHTTVNVTHGARNLEATWAATSDVHTLCFHIKSVLAMTSGKKTVHMIQQSIAGRILEIIYHLQRYCRQPNRLQHTTQLAICPHSKRSRVRPGPKVPVKCRCC